MMIMNVQKLNQNDIYFTKEIAYFVSAFHGAKLKCELKLYL